MRGKTFFIACLSAFILCSAGYFAAVDRLAIPERVVERSYRQFMLEASDSIPGRIIISSGSNSIHSVMAGMIEDHFGKPAINISDNGSYPVEYRIYNLTNHVSRGDLILLPLEWGYYAEKNRLPENYVKSILDKAGSNSFYYRELPFYEKARFIFKHLPFSLALKRMAGLNAVRRFNKALARSESDSLQYIYNSIDEGLRGSYIIDDGPMEVAKDGAHLLDCDKYILAKNIKNGFIVSGQFKKNLRLLTAMVKKTGAKVLFTWPAVVGKTGNECYTSEIVKKNLKGYAQKIKEEVEKYGFRFIGDVYDSRFDKRCFRNTYYHVTHNCGIERTKKLIKLLEEEGVEKKAGYSTGETKKTLYDYAQNLEISFLTGLKTIPVNFLIEDEDMTKYLRFRKGWSHQEKWGVWSTGEKSIIIFPNPEEPYAAIRFKGSYFNGREKTAVWINGELMGRFFLTDKVIKVGKNISGAGLIRITLEHKNPVSPLELGKSKDERKIKYGLRAIELIDGGFNTGGGDD